MLPRWSCFFFSFFFFSPDPASMSVANNFYEPCYACEYMKLHFREAQRCLSITMSHTNEYEMASMNPEPPNHSLPPAPASEASLPPNITNTITPQESGNSTEDEFERQWAANPDFYADVRFYGSFSYLPYDYLLFKNEPFGKSFRDLICVETLRLRSSEEPIEPHLTVADKASFSECLDRLRLCLTLEEANCLRVWFEILSYGQPWEIISLTFLV